MAITDQAFSKLVVKGRFVTPAQLNECREEQAAIEQQGQPTPRLAELLVKKGYLGAAELETILAAVGQKTDRLFGEIAVKWNLLTTEQLDESLAEQLRIREEKGTKARLGGLLVKRDLLKPHQVASILEEQGKQIAKCGECNRSYNVRLTKEKKTFKCRRCGKPLTVMGTDASIDADATLITPAIAPPPEEAAVKPKPKGMFGEYKPLKLLGQDGTGDIYKARRESDQRLVALKVYNRDYSRNTQYIDALKANVQKVARLSHPNLRKIYSMGTVEGKVYVALEYIEGESLRSILLRNEHLSVKKALVIGAKLCQALKYIHHNAQVHGDIRPSNIIVSTDGRVILSNLGLSPKPTDSIQRIVASGQLAPFYVAPEQVVDDRPVDFRADIYGLGATLYHLVAGRPAFEGQSPYELLIRYTEDYFPPPQMHNPDVPGTVGRIIEKMVSADPDHRYQSLDELAHDLEHPDLARIEGDRDVGARPLSATMDAVLAEQPQLERLARPLQEAFPIKLALACIVVIALIIGGLAFLSSAEEDAALQKLTEEYNDLSQYCTSHRRAFDMQPAVVSKCKNFLAQHPELSPERQARVREWITEVERLRMADKQKKVDDLRGEITLLLENTEYPKARAIWGTVKNRHDFDEWNSTITELDRQIIEAQRNGWLALKEKGDKLVGAGSLTQAIELYETVPEKFDGQVFEDRAKSEIKTIRKLIADQAEVADAKKLAESLEQAKQAIKATRLPERKHEYNKAIGELEVNVLPRVRDPHKPMIQARILELKRQRLILQHFAGLDMSRVTLQLEFEGRTQTIERMNERTFKLRGRAGGIGWIKIAARDIYRIARESAKHSKLGKELQLGIGIFALRHELRFEAVEALHPMRDDAEVKDFWNEARQLIVVELRGKMKAVAADPNPTQRLIACLAIEREYRRMLALLDQESATLNQAIARQFRDVVGKGGQLAGFDTAEALGAGFDSGGKNKPQWKTRARNGYLMMARSEITTKWKSDGTVAFLFATHPGKDTKMELQMGAFKSFITFSETGQVRASLIAGLKNAHLKHTLTPGHHIWHVLQFKPADGGIEVLLDGKTVTEKPFPAGKIDAPLKLKVASSTPIDLDLLHTGTP